MHGVDREDAEQVILSTELEERDKAQDPRHQKNYTYYESERADHMRPPSMSDGAYRAADLQKHRKLDVHSLIKYLLQFEFSCTGPLGDARAS